MTTVVVRNQTPRHLVLHGPDDTLKLAPLQRRRLGHDPRCLFGDAASAARTDQVFDWEAEPTRSTVLHVSSVSTALTVLSVLVAAGALIVGDPAVAAGAAGTGVSGLLATGLAVRLGRRDAPDCATCEDPSAGSGQPVGITDLLRDLLVGTLQYTAFVLLVVIGVAAPAVALWFGTDLGHVVAFVGLRPVPVPGDEARQVLVVRGLQLVLIVLVSLVPALMFFQFDREKLTTLVDRWLHVVFRLDPTVVTVSDVDAKYGRRVEEFLGASLGLGVDTTSKRLRDRSPVVLSTVLLALGWIVVLLSVPVPEPGDAPLTVPEMFAPQLTPVTMAFLGAYFLSVQVTLRGFVRGDLKPKTYNVVTVRILMAVVLTWALQAVAGDGRVVLATAFLAGVVPSTVLLKVRTFAGAGATTDDELDRRSPLTQIDEIDVYERTRLEEEGITSVQALARHDLVDLMLSSRIPAPRLVDWVDQALLLQHTTAETTTLLRAHGVRCATDLVQVARHRAPLDELTAALAGRCSPALLLASVENDEWLGYLLHWREHEDGATGPPLVYGVGPPLHRQVGPPAAEQLDGARARRTVVLP